MLKTIFSQRSLSTHARPYFDGGNASTWGSGIKSVSGGDLSSLLKFELKARSTTSLYESESISERDEVNFWFYSTYERMKKGRQDNRLAL